MNKVKHWLAFVIFWSILGPLIVGCVGGICYAAYLIVQRFTEMIIVMAGLGVFILMTRWAGNYLDAHGFLPWKPKPKAHE